MRDVAVEIGATRDVKGSVAQVLSFFIKQVFGLVAQVRIRAVFLTNRLNGFAYRLQFLLLLQNLKLRLSRRPPERLAMRMHHLQIESGEIEKQRIQPVGILGELLLGELFLSGRGIPWRITSGRITSGRATFRRTTPG